MFCVCLAVRFRPLNQVRNRRADPDTDARLRALNKLLTESPALLAREQPIYARYTDALAALVAKETHADPSGIAPRVAASAMLGLCRALVTQGAIRCWLANPTGRASPANSAPRPDRRPRCSSGARSARQLRNPPRQKLSA